MKKYGHLPYLKLLNHIYIFQNSMLYMMNRKVLLNKIGIMVTLQFSDTADTIFPKLSNYHINMKINQHAGVVAHVCNPIYLG
jgi:hypothetical protein